MFESKDLSRGLSRGENIPGENGAEKASASVYTAYTQSAENFYGNPDSRRDAFIAAEKGKKRKKRARRFVAAAAAVAVLGCAGGVFSLLYRVDVSESFSGLSINISRRGNRAEEIAGDTFTAIPAQEKPSRGAEAVKAELVSGNGVRLDISGTPTARVSKGEMSYGDIYERCAPSVVSVSTAAYGGSCSGTGVIMQSDGYIITNAHVIEGAYGISVTLWDGKQFSAAVIGMDTASDLAVLKIDAENLTAAEFGSSDMLRVGDEVVAIGNPFSQNLTMTNGIISAINRNVSYDGNTMTLIQTNAAINEGNSGGPLINMYGQVIGIINMKLTSRYVDIEGIGYAIPSATAKTVVDELVEHGYVSGRPGIGVTLEEIPQSAIIYYGLPNGLYVRSVRENSDAFAKGIRAGDMITAMGGTPVKAVTDISAVMDGYAVGDTMRLTVFRGGSCYDVDVTLMDMGMFD